MERRAGAHTEEEELNQRRRLLNLARKGDPKAIGRLFELYQVRVYTGEQLGKGGKLPEWPKAHQPAAKASRRAHPSRKRARKAARPARRVGTRKPSRARKRSHRSRR